MLRILYDDFDQKVKNIHDEMDLHHSYKKKACTIIQQKKSQKYQRILRSAKLNSRENEPNFSFAKLNSAKKIFSAIRKIKLPRKFLP